MRGGEKSFAGGDALFTLSTAFLRPVSRTITAADPQRFRPAGSIGADALHFRNGIESLRILQREHFIVAFMEECAVLGGADFCSIIIHYNVFMNREKNGLPIPAAVKLFYMTKPQFRIEPNWGFETMFLFVPTFARQVRTIQCAPAFLLGEDSQTMFLFS